MDLLIKTDPIVSTTRIPTQEEARQALARLRDWLKSMIEFYEAGGESADIPAHCFPSLCFLDSFLTQKTRLGCRREGDFDDLRRVADCYNVEFYLSDGGYSRIYIGLPSLAMGEEPLSIGSQSLLQTKERWEEIQ